MKNVQFRIDISTLSFPRLEMKRNIEILNKLGSAPMIGLRTALGTIRPAPFRPRKNIHSP